MKEYITWKMKPLLFAVAVLIGIMLIYFSDHGTETKEKRSGENLTELESYGENLERKLSETVSGIDGAGKATVMITFESSFEKVYASNARVEENTGNANGGRSTEKKIALAGTDSYGESPVLLKELCPKVRGVVVVCKGADNPETEKKIRDAAASLFGISELRVYVAKGTG